jgi:hypothetical protein
MVQPVNTDRPGHHCHALGCHSQCPPRHLMCAAHWEKVPPALQTEVYNTQDLKRGKPVGADWAPWWRAQARAIAHVAFLESPDVGKRDRYLAKEFAFADRLQRKKIQ